MPIVRPEKAVTLTGAQTVAGVKTFSSSPVVPTPTTDMQASTKKYVDDNIVAGGSGLRTATYIVAGQDSSVAEMANADVVFDGTHQANTDALQALIVTAEAANTKATIYCCPGTYHFQLEAGSTFTLNKCHIMGAGPQRTNWTLYGTDAGFLAGVDLRGEAYGMGNISNMTISTEDGFAGAAVQLKMDSTSEAMTCYKWQGLMQNLTVSGGTTAGSIGVNLEAYSVGGLQASIYRCEIGPLLIHQYEKGLRIYTWDDGHGDANAFINDNHFPSVITSGCKYGIWFEADGDAIDGNIFSSVIMSHVSPAQDGIYITGTHTVYKNIFTACVFMDWTTDKAIFLDTNTSHNFFIAAGWTGGYTVFDDDGSNNFVWPLGYPIYKTLANVDSVALVDAVSIGAYDISAGHRALAISSEEVVAVEVDETKFSHKYPVRINGATYYMMLTAT